MVAALRLRSREAAAVLVEKRTRTEKLFDDGVTEVGRRGVCDQTACPEDLIAS
jgi:hypothetical protein